MTRPHRVSCRINAVPGFSGVKYAMISMKLMMVSVLRRYSVHTDCKMSEIKMQIDFLAKKADGYPITIRPRTRNRTQTLRGDIDDVASNSYETRL